MKINLENDLLEKYNHLASSLSIISSFVSNHESMTYIEFDYYTVHDLTLFSIDTDFDFKTLSKNVSRFENSLGAIKRIFSHPIIHLRENDDVLPVESVRIINQNTMAHVLSHTENVTNITSKGIKPRRLLTRVYEDNYGIYENIVFCNFVDTLMAYCRKSINTLKNLIYASETLEFNLLERVNHLNYFLAIGKLHTGYIRDFNKYYTESRLVTTRLESILDSLKSRLKKPIYRTNKNRNTHLPLKKTNIFLMQKDYHRVYKEYKFLKKNYVDTELLKEPDYRQIQSNYFNYLEILIIFSIGHFNYSIDLEEPISLSNLDSTFKYKKWKIGIKKIGTKSIVLEIKKSKTYKILLVSEILKKNLDLLSRLKTQTKCDELVVCTPFEDFIDDDSVLINIEDIDSFRRIQQIILRGMIYSDSVHHDCPFCNGDLKKYDDYYECESCRTVIKDKTCPETSKKYYSTSISNLDIDDSKFIDIEKGSWLYNRKKESAMYFRNITRINEKMKMICPCCGKIHED